MADRINKWLYGWKFYVDYGYGDGFEYEIFEETYKGMQENRVAYMRNLPEGASLKVSPGREKNPKHPAWSDD